MPDAVCIKAGGIDDREARDFKSTSVEFYCKDRMAYSKAVEGAKQEPVSGHFFFPTLRVFGGGGWGLREGEGADLVRSGGRCLGDGRFRASVGRRCVERWWVGGAEIAGDGLPCVCKVR